MSLEKIPREVHLQWCKDRALEILDAGDIQQAVTSMMSDLGKHEETEGVANVMAPMAMYEMMHGTSASARRFITGFN